MEQMILFVFTFLFVYLFYLFFIVLRKKTISKYDKSKEVMYLKNKYKLDLSKINMKILANTIGLLNAFIIALVLFVIDFFDSFIFKMLIGFVTLFPIILISYHILGKILQKNYGKK